MLESAAIDAAQSRTCVTYPIVAALVKAEEMPGMGKNRVWTASNGTQIVFLNNHFEGGRSEVTSIPEITSIASSDADEINRFLRERGYAIQLLPMDAMSFGVASVLDLLVEWVAKGTETTVLHKGTTYPAVRLGEKTIEVLRSPRHPAPILSVFTQGLDQVWMTPLREQLKSFDLVQRAMELQESAVAANEDYTSAVFPMVDLDQQVDISWLCGLSTTGSDGRPATIAQAMQQTKLRMNEVGAHAESAVAIEVLRGMPARKQELVINEPFLLWISREGLTRPLFVGFLCPDVWKKPASL